FGDRLNAAARFGAPRHDQTRVAELSFAKENCLCAFHFPQRSTRTIEALRCGSRVILSAAQRSRRIPWRYLELLPQDLIRPPPVPSAPVLPVDVAASPAAPFSTPLGMTFCSKLDFAVVSFASHHESGNRENRKGFRDSC